MSNGFDAIKQELKAAKIELDKKFEKMAQDKAYKLKIHLNAFLRTADKRSVLYGWIDHVKSVTDHLFASLGIGQAETVMIALTDIENPEIITTAEGRQCIQVPRQRDALRTADDILFESCNAEAAPQYKALDREFGRDPAPSLSKYGKDKAEIEANVTLKYLKLVQEIEQANQAISDSEDLKRALKNYNEVCKGDDAQFVKHVCDSPHKSDAADHQRLNSRTLYEIEKVFVLTTAQIESKLVQPLLKKLSSPSDNWRDYWYGNDYFKNWLRRTLNAVTPQQKPRALVFIIDEANANRPADAVRYELPIFSRSAIEVLIGGKLKEFPGLALNPLPEGYKAWCARGHRPS